MNTELDTVHKLKGIDNFGFTWTPEFLINVVGMTEGQLRTLCNDQKARDYFEQDLVEAMKGLVEHIPEDEE